MGRPRVVMRALCGAMAVAVVLAQVPQKGGDYPQVWCQTPGKGHVLHGDRPPRGPVEERRHVPPVRDGRDPLGAPSGAVVRRL